MAHKMPAKAVRIAIKGVKTIMAAKTSLIPQRKYDAAKMQQATRLFIEAVGDDPRREGLRDTPRRVAAMYGKLLNGLDLDPRSELVTFEPGVRGTTGSIVFVGRVPFYSFCEHHLMLFAGHAHLAYIPSDRVLGLSKLVRMMRAYAKRLQIQERLTEQVATALYEASEGLGSMVLLEAEHFCMSIRGVRSPGAITKTASAKGQFTKGDYQNEFYKMVERTK